MVEIREFKDFRGSKIIPKIQERIRKSWGKIKQDFKREKLKISTEVSKFQKVRKMGKILVSSEN